MGEMADYLSEQADYPWDRLGEELHKTGGSKQHTHQQAKCSMLPCLGYLEAECEDCVESSLYRKP